MTHRNNNADQSVVLFHGDIECDGAHVGEAHLHCDGIIQVVLEPRFSGDVVLLRQNGDVGPNYGVFSQQLVNGDLKNVRIGLGRSISTGVNIEFTRSPDKNCPILMEPMFPPPH